MTISSTDNRKEYTGNGSTTAFSFPYYFLAAADLKVYQAGTLKTLTTHYTVSGAGNPAGGTVTFNTAPTTGQSVVILRDPALTQSIDYTENDPFPAETHESGLDRLTMIAQRLEDKLGQALLVPDYEQFGGVLPNAATRANKYLVFDADGDPTASDADVEYYATLAETSATAAAASETAAAVSASSAATAAAKVEGVIPSFQTFSGTGAQTAFTLSSTPSSKDALDVYISGVYQQKSKYSLSGSTLTFTSAPASGTNNIEVKVAPLVAFATLGSVDLGSIV